MAGTSGFRSCAHWLNWRTGLDLGAAREKVRVTRVATIDNEEELLEFARAGTAAHVETLVRAWRRVNRTEKQEREELRRASRYLQAYTDEDGMVVLKARLEPEAGPRCSRLWRPPRRSSTTYSGRPRTREGTQPLLRTRGAAAADREGALVAGGAEGRHAAKAAPGRRTCAAPLP